nr:luciferin 4-monooxygenase-like [Leptinotarsa decemlineata]
MEKTSFILNGLEPCEPIPEDLVGKVLLQSLRRDGGDRDALVDASTGITLSYNGILEQTCNLAEALRRCGTGPDSINVICSENNLEYFIPVLACLYLGCTVVPINHLYTSYELEYSLELTEPNIIFCSQATLKNIRKCGEKYLTKLIVIDSTDDVPGTITLKEFVTEHLNGISVMSQEFQPFNASNPAKHVAFILSSSGTTGLPKGVMITHEMILVRIAQSRHPLMISTTEHKVNLGILPFFHVYGMCIGITSIVNREILVILKRFEPNTFLKAIQDYKITSMSLAPPIINFLAKSPLLDDYDLSSVDEVYCGGAPLNASLGEISINRLKIRMIRQIYGLTETIAITISNPIDVYNPTSSGKVVPYMKIKIVDQESFEVLGPNQLGEIHVKGPIMKGYYKNEQATRDSFSPDGWFKTGDLGYYDEDGYLFNVDRLKEMIKYKAHQVAPAEIEAILINHPSVLDAGVVGIPDDEAGELPLAFVVKQSGIDVTERELQEYVSQKVSPQKRLRGGIIFVSAIPKSTSGKILRKELRKKIGER